MGTEQGQSSLLVHQPITQSWGYIRLCLLPQSLKCQPWKGKQEEKTFPVQTPFVWKKARILALVWGLPPTHPLASLLRGSTPLVTVNLFSFRPQAACFAVGNSPS